MLGMGLAAGMHISSGTCMIPSEEVHNVELVCMHFSLPCRKRRLGPNVVDLEAGTQAL